MSILGNPITLGGGGSELNIDFGSTPPTDTSKLWVPLGKKPSNISLDAIVQYGDEIITLDYTYTQELTQACGGVIDGKLYITAGKSSGGTSDVTPIYVYDTVNKTFSLTGDSLPFSILTDACGVVAGDSLYIIGGYGRKTNSSPSSSRQLTIYKYTPSTHSVILLGVMGNVSSFALRSQRACVLGNRIYYLGGYEDSAPTYTHGYIDLETNAIVNISGNVSLLQRRWLACAAYGNYIYTFGGNYNSSYYNTICKYDPQTNTATQISGQVLSQSVSYLSVAQFGQYVYLFAGTISDGYATKIYRFDCISETITELGVSMPAQMVWSYGASDGNIAYVFGGNQKAIYKFVIKSPLQQNNLLIQYDCFSQNSKKWQAINDKTTEMNLYPVDAYLGNSQNYAEKQSARLFNQTTGQWETLDGTSAVQDMVNALNIMGVN